MYEIEDTLGVTYLIDCEETEGRNPQNPNFSRRTKN